MGRRGDRVFSVLPAAGLRALAHPRSSKRPTGEVSGSNPGSEVLVGTSERWRPIAAFNFFVGPFPSARGPPTRRRGDRVLRCSQRGGCAAGPPGDFRGRDSREGFLDVRVPPMGARNKAGIPAPFGG